MRPLTLALLATVAACADPAAAPSSDAYYLVRASGAPLYSSDGQRTTGALGAGFGVRVVRIFDAAGRHLATTSRGRTLRLADLAPAPGSSFAGRALSPNAAPPSFATPSGSRVVVHFTPRPTEVAAHERWIDVDLASQTLVAYQGDQPRFATLVSTGVGTPGSPIATPTGSFRVQSKLRESDMDNAGHTDVAPYLYEAVPHVQYFHHSMALHATLWHDRFGQRMSHGCINLSPRDAAWLFDFTSPHLAASEREARSTPDRAGTFVHIH